MKSKRIVIKIGSSSLTTNGTLNIKMMNSLARQVALLYNLGVEIVIVSSGAVACGRAALTLKKTKYSSQVAAIYGQNLLMNQWSSVFHKHNVHVGQVLLSESDLQSPNTPLVKGLKHGVQIINANDAVNDSEMKAFFVSSDNDKLSGHIAEFIKADTLILLTDVDGVWDDKRKVIRTLKQSNKVKMFAKSSAGTGGIQSKINVGFNSTKKGVKTVIANAHAKNVVLDILMGKQIGTVFEK